MSFNMKAISIGLLLIVILAGVVLCPLILDVVGARFHVDSHRVSELGASYSAASALLAAARTGPGGG